VRNYVAHVVRTDKEIAPAIRGRISSEHYIETVAHRCGGNFLYLHYFFQSLREDIRSGVSDFLNLESVPTGLHDFYRVILIERIKGGLSEERWEDVYVPVLGILAVARGPLSARHLAGFAGVVDLKVASVLGKIGQFLHETWQEEEVVYQIYHTSFSEYLLDRRLNHDYPLDGPAYHYKLASYYRTGYDNWGQVDWRKIADDEYPFRHLAKHLKESSAPDELYALIGRPWMTAQFDHHHSHRAFAGDVELAVNTAEAEDPPNLVQVIRGCLIHTTLRSSVAVIPLEALVALCPDRPGGEGAGLCRPYPGARLAV
jgi:serine/threonine-protein kinase